MKEAIRNFIIEKAAKIFSEKGFKNTTMDEVAEISQVSKPTLYNYFPGKDELFCEVLVNINKEVDNIVLGGIDLNKDIFENLKKIILNNFEFLIKHKKIMKIALFESDIFTKNKKGSKFKEFINDRERRKNFLLNLLIRGQKDGKIRDDLDAEILSLIYLGAMKEISFEIIFLDYKIEDINILTDNIVDILKNGIKRR